MEDCPNDTSNGYGSHNSTHPLPCNVDGCDCLAALRKDAERYRKLVACGKYAAASIGGGWGLAHSGVHTGRSSGAELDAAADALPAVGAA